MAWRLRDGGLAVPPRMRRALGAFGRAHRGVGSLRARREAANVAPTSARDLARPDTRITTLPGFASSIVRVAERAQRNGVRLQIAASGKTAQLPLGKFRLSCYPCRVIFCHKYAFLTAFFL